MIDYLFNFLRYNIPSKKYLFNIKVDLSKINFFIEKKNIVNRKNFLWYGNWDNHKISIDEYSEKNINYSSVFEIFKFNINYKESKEYKKKLSELSTSGITTRGQKTVEELDSYFESLIKLKSSLEKNGYKSQKQLNSLNHNDEIGVVIGRNGEIIKLEDKFGGTHRFALCQILNITDVFINIKAIHSNFVDITKIKEMISSKNNSIFKDFLKEKINKSLF